MKLMPWVYLLAFAPVLASGRESTNCSHCGAAKQDSFVETKYTLGSLGGAVCPSRISVKGIPIQLKSDADVNVQVPYSEIKRRLFEIHGLDNSESKALFKRLLKAAQSATSIDDVKVKYEAELEAYRTEKKEAHPKIFYNAAVDQLGAGLKQGRLQCYTGTVLFALIVAELRKKNPDLAKDVVILHTPDHVLPGYLSKKEGELTLTGIETTVNGKGIVDSYGSLKKALNEKGNELRVTSLDDYLLFEALKLQTEAPEQTGLAMVQKFLKENGFNDPKLAELPKTKNKDRPGLSEPGPEGSTVCPEPKGLNWSVFSASSGKPVSKDDIERETMDRVSGGYRVTSAEKSAAAAFPIQAPRAAPPELNPLEKSVQDVKGTISETDMLKLTERETRYNYLFQRHQEIKTFGQNHGLDFIDIVPFYSLDVFEVVRPPDLVHSIYPAVETLSTRWSSKAEVIASKDVQISFPNIPSKTSTIKKVQGYELVRILMEYLNNGGNLKKLNDNERAVYDLLKKSGQNEIEVIYQTGPKKKKAVIRIDILKEGWEDGYIFKEATELFDASRPQLPDRLI